MMVKKLVLLISGIIILNTAFAQEAVTKKGAPVLPHKGDWGVGFDVVPIIQYAGNLFHDAGNHNDISINTPFSISALYCHTDKLTYRFSLRLKNSSTKQDDLVPKLGSTNVNEQVANETIASDHYEQLSFGMKRMVGKSRVRGFYGGEAGFSFQSAKTKYSYGNPLGPTNPVNSDTASIKQGSTIGVGLRAFLGVEVYIAPRIALSAEYGLSPFDISRTGANEIVIDSWDGSAVKSEIKSTIGKASTINYFNSDNNSGSVSLLFYF